MWPELLTWIKRVFIAHRLILQASPVCQSVCTPTETIVASVWTPASEESCWKESKIEFARSASLRFLSGWGQVW